MKTFEFQELSKRIRSASDLDALHRLERSASRIYNANLLTVREFARLDVLIMEKLALIANKIGYSNL